MKAKASRDFPSVFGGYLTSGGILCLYVGVRSLPLLRSRLKNGPPPKPCDLCMVRFITLCFMMSKARMGGDIFEMQCETWLPPHPRHLILGMLQP